MRRADAPGANAAGIARDLGIHPGQIYNWRRQYKRLSDKQFNSVDGVDYSKSIERLTMYWHSMMQESLEVWAVRVIAGIMRRWNLSLQGLKSKRCILKNTQIWSRLIRVFSSI